MITKHCQSKRQKSLHVCNTHEFLEANYLQQNVRAFTIAQFFSAESDTSQQVSGYFQCNYVLTFVELHFFVGEAKM